MENHLTMIPIFCPKIFAIACALDETLKELTYEEVYDHILVIDHEKDNYYIITEDSLKEHYDFNHSWTIPTYIATKK